MISCTSHLQRQLSLFDKAVNFENPADIDQTTQVSTLQELALKELIKQFQNGEISARYPSPPGLKIVTLDNGFTIYFQNRHIEGTSNGVASIKLLARTGFLAETPENQNISHLLEHCLFLGTEKYTCEEIDQLIKKFNGKPGADNNATTTFDQTGYFFNNISTSELTLFQDAVDLLFQLACKANFPPEKIVKEREMVVNELSRISVLNAETTKKMYGEFFPDSQYLPHFPIKLSETLINYDANELQAHLLDFYKTWYAAHNMALFVVGDFGDAEGSRVKEEGVFNFITDTFAQLPSSSQQARLACAPIPCHVNIPKYTTQVSKQLADSAVSIYQNVSQNVATTKFQKHLSDIKFCIQDKVMQTAFTELAGSTENEIVECKFRGMFPNCSATTKTFLEQLVYILVNEGKLAGNLKKILTAIQEQIATGLSSAELASYLDNEVKQYRRTIPQIASTAHGTFVRSYSAWDINRFFNYPQPELSDLFAHSFMHALVARYYHNFENPKNYFDSIALFDPKRQDELSFFVRSAGTKDKISDIKKVIKEVSRLSVEKKEEYVPLISTDWLPARPPAAKITLKEELPDLGCQRIVLDNGISVIFKKTEDPNPLIQLTYRQVSEQPLFTSTLKRESIRKALEILSVLPLGGISNRDYALSKMDKSFALQKISFNTNALGTTMNVGKEEELELALKYFYLLLTDRSPLYTKEFETRFNNNIKNRIDLEKQWLNTISKQSTKAEKKLLWGDHPLVKVLLPEDWELINLEDTRADTEKMLDHPSQKHLVVCGNFDIGTIEPLILDYIGGLPRTKIDGNEANGNETIWETPRIPEEFFMKLDIDNVADRYKTTLAFPFYAKTDRIYKTLEPLVVSILSELINSKLRTEDQKTYGIQVQIQNHPIRDTLKYLSIKFSCNQKSREGLKADVLHLLKECKEWTEDDIKPHADKKIDYLTKEDSQISHLTPNSTIFLADLILEGIALESHQANSIQEYSLGQWLDAIKNILSGIDDYKELVIAPKEQA